MIGELQAMTDKPFAINLWVSMDDDGARASDEAAFERSLRRLHRSSSRSAVRVAYTKYSPMKFEEQARVLIDANVSAFSFIFGIPPKEILDECRAKDRDHRRRHHAGPGDRIAEAKST